MTTLRRRIEALEKAARPRRAPLEIWTRDEYEHWLATGQRPDRDLTVIPPPPVVLMVGNGVLCFLNMPLEEL